MSDDLESCKWALVHFHCRELWPTSTHQLPFQECWSVCVIHKLLDVTSDHVCHQLETTYQLVIPTVSQYHIPVTSLILPCLYFPFSPLATPANTLVSLLLQLMKATVLAESSILYFIFSLGSLCFGDVYRCEPDSCWTLPFFLTFFNHYQPISSFYPPTTALVSISDNRSPTPSYTLAAAQVHERVLQFDKGLLFIMCLTFWIFLQYFQRPLYVIHW